MNQMIDPKVSLTPGKRVLFITKDPELVRRQLRGELDLKMKDLNVADLRDDISTDDMTPAWACFNHRPEDIAVHAYAGLVADDQRIFADRALLDGGFEIVVSGERKGVGSSRETAVQAEKWCGIRIAIADSFAPIHARNNVNQGVLMGDHAVLCQLQSGEEVDLEAFMQGYDEITRLVVQWGGLFSFYAALKAGKVSVPKTEVPDGPMTMVEKIISNHLRGAAPGSRVRPGEAVLAQVDGGYSHEFTSAQVHLFLQENEGEGYAIDSDPERFAVFEDHLIYADGVERMAPFSDKIETLRQWQRDFQKHTGVQDYAASGGTSPGICHQIAREKLIDPGDLILATDSHTCMGGGNNAYAYGVGATEYAALLRYGFTTLEVPESVRFELTGALPPGVTAKDLMLYILLEHARKGDTLNRVLEFGGSGLASLPVDERATLANMATECSAKTGLFEADDATIQWLSSHRPGVEMQEARQRMVLPDPGAEYAMTIKIDLSTMRPMVATPGDLDNGIPSDPTNGAWIDELGEVPIDIAYGGSCTAGKEVDFDMYAQVFAEAVACGRKVADGVECFIQFGSRGVEEYARSRGYVDVIEAVGAKVIPSGCGACIGCGPGVSTNADQVTVSAINRNFRGRSGPGQMYLASPFSVAASAIEGRICSFRSGMFVADRQVSPTA